MKYFGLFSVILALAAGCATTPPVPDRPVTAGDLVGTWQSFEKGGTEQDQIKARQATVKFAGDGRVRITSVREEGSAAFAGTFVPVESSILMIRFDEGAEGLEQFPFELRDGVLTVYDSAADAWLKFRRQPD